MIRKLVFAIAVLCGTSFCADLPIVEDVEAQPLWAQARRVIETLEFVGSPLPENVKTDLEKAAGGDKAAFVKAIQAALDPYCLAGVNINPESRVKVAQGPAKAQLFEQGARVFLVKVHNEAGVTAKLQVESPNSQPVYSSKDAPGTITTQLVADRWLDIQMNNSQPMTPTLSGLKVEYRVVTLYSRDAGKREAKISFNVGQGTQDIGFRNAADILFDCEPSKTVTFRVKDDDGQPTMGKFTIRDKKGRIYPSRAKRLAPDFFFHDQIYRADGETIKLPVGTYEVEYTRGPEYLAAKTALAVTGDTELSVNLKRWIDPAKLGWWSGDHHIHAAGCAHYTNPTEGVHAPDMMRHCLGEDLKVGCNLTWGPCFDYQKQFFTGSDDKVSKYPYLLRYDIEVSGFGSHQSGHLCLLRLKDQMYPGGTSKNHWPTLGLNTLRWAQKQGAVCGPAHSGSGLDVIRRPEGAGASTAELPNYTIPKYDGIGANEFIVDITHQVPGPDGKLVPAIDFISTVDTNPYSELNIWYHSLNVGYRVRASGETDFPCIYGQRVGIGRSYVKLPEKLDYDAWCEGIRRGANYVSEANSHLMEFKANDAVMGENGSELKLDKPGTVKLTAKVAALLPEQPNPKEFITVWHIEKARIPNTRKVKVEALVNGKSVGTQEITADGTTRDMSFDVKIDKSSWVALRVFPSSHTNPIFVLVDGKPIRASKKSAEWCAKGVEQCWSQKERTYKADEKEDAKKAYDHAREAYKKLIEECVAD